VAGRFVRLRVVPGGIFDERADGLEKADDVRPVDNSKEVIHRSLAGRSGGRGERSWVSVPLGSESTTYARGVPRAAFRFVRRYFYELGRCNSLNTAWRSRVVGGRAASLKQSRMRRGQGYAASGSVP
jgi:hypothetical protein